MGKLYENLAANASWSFSVSRLAPRTAVLLD